MATLILTLFAGTALAATLLGTDAPDTLTGTDTEDFVSGGGGSDDVHGRGGSDVLYGGAGGDQTNGGAGEDVLYGGPGGDHVHADDGARDVVFCGGGNDTVFADRVDRVLTGCETDGVDALKGGVLATFEASGERFRVWVVNPQTIWDLYQLKRGESTANIPNGRILRGPGRSRHNAPYSWHLDPQDISMADVTVEVCDARPSYVEENVAEFVDNVGRYCPWNARLVELRNYTGAKIEPPTPEQEPPPVTFPDEG
jgi:hypothetical protein